MAEFTVNAQRFDPYKNFKFRVKWDGRYVAGVSKVGALKRTTEVVKHREGGDPSSSRKSPARTEFEAVTLERGVTHDTEFEKWANKVWNFGSGLGAEGDPAALTVGELDRRLLDLRRSAFGEDAATIADCPACGERLEAELRLGELLAGEDAEPGPFEARVGGRRASFRLPTAGD